MAPRHEYPRSVETTEIDVDEATVDAFREDGVAVLRGAASEETLALLAEGVEFNRTNPSAWSHWYTDEDEAVGFWSDYVTWPDVEQYRSVARQLIAASRTAWRRDRG